ncbi:MAG: MFS transporter [Acidipropionibacterium acidipropionici]|nr:MFS transporter [Acidipropionibacterium acidipropionici]MDN6555293.1 MFS transporter [Acidipropionibacterium acidipropionici]
MSVDTQHNRPSGLPEDGHEASASTDPAGRARHKISGKLVGSIVATAILSFLGLLLETVVNILFPALMSDFGITMSAVSWMTTGYLLVVSVIMPLSGYLQRRFTARSLFITAAVTVMAGAVVAAMAPAYPVLLAGRLLQGIGTGIATPLMFSIIMMQAPRPKVGMLMGVGGLILGIAPALGPTLGGAIGTLAGWRPIFWLNIPLLVIALIVGTRSIQQATPTRKETLAIGQLVLLALGLVGLVLGIERIGALVSSGSAGAAALAVAIGLPFVGLVCLALFVRAANRSEHPLIHLNVLRDGTYAWSLVAFACLQFITLGLGYVLPTYAQMAMGHTSLVAGLAVLPAAVVGAAFAPLGGVILDHVGARVPIMTGAVVALVAAVLLALFGVGVNLFLLAAMYLLFMLGFGLAFANTQTHGMAHVAQHLTPDATAMMNTCQQFAGALSMTVLSTIVAVRQSGLTSGTAAFQHGTRSGSAGGLAVLAAVAVVVLVAEHMGLKKRD